ncbi:uncharacterized protein LOC135483816 [Lineus longissimus]|uniref:uncharacterized protein LOC135483816 n=1 Tax=Lineus longissimus TaxID=88925 RepID=UPI00315D29F9
MPTWHRTLYSNWQYRVLFIGGQDWMSYMYVKLPPGCTDSGHDSDKQRKYTMVEARLKRLIGGVWKLTMPKIAEYCSKRKLVVILLTFGLIVLGTKLNVSTMFKTSRDAHQYLMPYPWKVDESLRPYFSSPLSSMDTNDLLRTLEVFMHTLDAANLTYFMYGGTLIGSYRNHGPIPWDDDLDFLCDLKQKQQLLDALSKLRPTFKMFTGYQWKFYMDDLNFRHNVGFFGRNIFRYFYRWCWPFVDIFFYDENATHIWDSTPWNKDAFVWRKEDVFPLKRRPFSYLWPYGPNNARKVLDTNYNISVCASNHQNHLTEHYYKDIKEVECAVLSKQYPFVHRTVLSNGSVKEELMLPGQTPLQTVIL